MKTRKASSLIFFLLTAAAASAHAGATAGAESFDFLLLDPSARAVGLGGAYTSLASDSNALFYNPAGLGRIKDHEATFMHNQYVEGLTQEQVGLATRSGWGLNINFLNFGGIPRTRLDAPDGGIGKVGLTNLALGGGYGRALSESISVGAGAKFLHEKIDNVSAGGFAADLGVLASVPSLPRLSLGAALLNLGPDVRFQSRKEKLPLLSRAGASYAFVLPKMDNTVTFDLTKARTDKLRFGFGAETVVDKFMALRLGFTTRNDAGIGITGGAGFVWKAWSIDYAFVPFGDLGVVQRFSLTFRWGTEADRDYLRTERKQAAFKEAPAPDEDEDLHRVRYIEKIGRTSLKESDCAGAMRSFAEAIRYARATGVKDPVVADAYAGIARCLLEEGKADYAEKFFHKALEAEPNSPTRVRIQSELKDLRLNKN